MASGQSRKFGRGLLLITTILVLGLLVAGSWLLETRSGLRYTLNTVFEYTELPIRYQNLQGTILTGIKADYVEYRSPAVTVEIKQFSTKVRLIPLVYKKLSFFAVNADRVKVDLADSANQSDEANAVNSINTANKSSAGLPISIGINNALLKNVMIMSAGQTVFEASKFKIRQSKVSDRFDFDNLKFDTPYGNLKSSGVLGFGKLTDVKLDMQWASKKIDNIDPMMGSTEISGNYQNIKLTSTITSPHQLHIRADFSDLFSNPTWNVTIKGQLIASALLGSNNIPNVDQLNVTSSGNPQQFNLNAKGQLNHSELGGWKFDLDSSANQLQWTVNYLKLASIGTAAKLQGNGTIDVAKEELQKSMVDLKLQWQDLNWPIVKNSTLERFSGNAAIKGTLQKYQMQIRDAAVNILHQEIDNINVSADGNDKSLNIHNFSCGFLAGDVKGNGKFSWEKALQGNATINLTALDPVSIFPEWSGKLSAHMSLDANNAKNTWSVSANISHTTGHLNQVKIDSGSARIALTQGLTKIRDLHIASGSNKVFGNFQYTQSADNHSDEITADWQLDLRDIGKLSPGAAGAVYTSGKISGDLSQPTVSMRLAMRNFRFDQYLVAVLQGSVESEIKDSGGLKVDVSAENVQIKGNKWQSAKLQVTGSMQQHKLFLNSQLAKDAGAVRIEAVGGYSDKVWRGHIADVTVNTSKYGDWDLLKPAKLEVTSNTVQMQKLCLAVKKHEGIVCNQVNVTLPNTWAGQAIITKFPLSGFNVIMPANLRIASGMLSGEINYDIDDGVIKKLQADLQSPAGSVNYRQYSGSEKLQDYKSLQLIVDNNDNGVQISNKIDLVDTGSMSMQLSFPGMQNISTVSSSQPVKGDLRMDLNNLGLLSLVFPDIQDITGKKHTQFTIAGTIAKPLIIGTSHITAQELSIPAVGIKLTQLDLRASSNANREIELNGQVNSGKGNLKLTGSLQDYSADKLTAKIHLVGANFRASATPELTLDISPDITVLLKDQKLTLNGDVRVPSANIQQLDTSSSLQPSSDLVMVDSEKSKKPPTPELQLATSLRIKLGKEVKIQRQDAFGRQLVGRLEGELLIKEQFDGLSVASGEIRIVDGKYTVFGQELSIEPGKLIYSSVPLTQPTLDIEAVKYVGTDE